ncbi:uncharacterized protein LOC143890638 [Tasmannia lanceolata]|uniref:uncharacterized protein LOC143890638 n=1 Tax=Tasmannia lanceolata TaxID=3420 RepID=UPI004063E634
MKMQADMHRTEREFEVGTWVYLRLQPYRQTSISLRRSLKLAPRFFGPFQIIERIGPVSYKLKLPDDSRIHPVFHVSCLKKKIGTRVVASSSLPTLTDAGVLQVAPYAILDRRVVKKHNRAVTEVLVHWVDTSLEDATWEPWQQFHERYPDFSP